MQTQHQSLLDSQKRLLESFRANAGKNYVGERFGFSQQAKSKSKYFSCKGVGFAVDISDSDLLSLAQQGYISVFADHPSIVFTHKAHEELRTEAEATRRPESALPSPQDKLFKADLLQIYAWSLVCLLAASAALVLLVVTALQVLNGNVTIGILSGMATIIPVFLTRVFFRQYEKANERLRHLRSRSSTERE
jgi:hypothetical protein